MGLQKQFQPPLVDGGKRTAIRISHTRSRGSNSACGTSASFPTKVNGMQEETGRKVELERQEQFEQTTRQANVQEGRSQIHLRLREISS